MTNISSSSNNPTATAGRPNHLRRPRTERAFDRPLPLASVVDGHWKARPKVHRTPRRLATLMTHPEGQVSDTILQEDGSGTLLCIAGDEFILVANTVSNLYIFRLTEACLSQNDDTVVAPWVTVCLSEEEARQAAAIVALHALPFGKSLIYGETCRKDEGHAVAFSDDGQGFIIRIRRDGKGKNRMMLSANLEYETIFSFSLIPQSFFCSQRPR